MEKEYTCFFTGHRMIANDEKEIIKEKLRSKIRYLNYEYGVTDFIAGGALGFDTLAAEAVLEERESNSQLKLHLFLPCKNQMSKWSKRDAVRGRLIADRADSIRYITRDNYITGCMQLRNREMAKAAEFCIAYCRHMSSGTGTTMKYAGMIGDTIYNIAEE